ncbi:MAG: hypothetical protein GJ677_08455 [Rhodobacteraceae bacterium]|nr:hypothetical protein [Paracoccaceae bacterium]
MTRSTGLLGRRDFLKTGATLLTAAPAALAVTKASAAPEFPDHMTYPGVEDELYGQP